MPYFFILPVFAALLFGVVAMGVIAHFVPKRKKLSRYYLAGAAGALIGFILVNVVVLFVGVAPAWLAQKFTFPNWLRECFQLFVAATLLIGPFFGSAIGVLLGSALGIFILFRRRQKPALPEKD